MTYLKPILSFIPFVAFFIFYPFILFLLFIISLSGALSIKHIIEKLGFINVPIPKSNEKNFTWFHFSSIGEYNGLKGFIKEYKKQEKVRILITYFNPDVVETLKKEALQDIFIPLPLENPFIFRKIIKTFNIKKIFFYENEFWPIMMSVLYFNNVKMYLLNAFIQDKEYRNMLFAYPLYYSILKMFKSIFCISEKHQKRFIRLGVKSQNIQVVGNLKYDTHLIKNNSKQITKSQLKWENSQVVSFISLHTKEWKLLKETFIYLVKNKIKVIIAPRLTKDTKSISSFLLKNKINASLKDNLLPSSDVLLINTFGELGQIYPLCDLCFIGGSLIPYGGHNLIEPISYNIKTLTGKYFFHFDDVFSSFKDKITITTPQTIKEDILYFLKNPNDDNGFIQLKKYQNVTKTILKSISHT